MADVRGMWYWKDMLTQANVDPNSLRTWEGYVSSAEKLINSILQGQDVQGIHLVGVGHSPDIAIEPFLLVTGKRIRSMSETYVKQT